MGKAVRHATEPTREPRRPVGVVTRFGVTGVLVMIGLTGCTVPTGGEGGSSEGHGYSTEALPIAVEGLEDCRGLTQALADGGRAEEGAEGAGLDGGDLPSLSLPCLNQDAAVALGELRDRPVLINLWASWCGPCRKEMPLLAEAASRTKNVSFLGVNTRDDPSMAAAFLPEVGVTYPQVVDVDGELLDTTRVRGLPVTLAVDAEGRIVDRVIGEVSADELGRLLSQLTDAA
ncbi:TlpA family protein disulfide reductase [Nocardioides daphniae]|nr:TlpA disulfide reductase family protein [Nocardioides daphniae]